VKNEAVLMILWSLLAVPQNTLGRPLGWGQGESEDDLSGTWLFTVHLTRSDGGALLPHTSTQNYKGPVTFVPAAKGHYRVAGNVSLAPKTDQERIHNVYFESCARLEGHDIAQTSRQTYTCSYEYGAVSRDQEGNGITTLFNGDLTFKLERGILRGRSKFVIRFTQTGEAHSEEAVWTGERQADNQDCATAQMTVDHLRSRVEADQDRIQRLDSGVTADDLNSFANATGEADHGGLGEALQQTEQAVADKQHPAIFEATFTHEYILARVDILKRLARNKWRPIEVKSSTSLKDYYLYDVAIQRLILEGLG